MSENTILDLDAMLDGNLDNTPDVPDYVTPPEGSYQLSIEDALLDGTGKDKEGNAVVRVIVTYKVDDTIETKDMPVANGSMFTERFTYNEEGLKYFKRAAKNILNVSDVTGVSLRDLFATLKGNGSFKAVITHSESTGDNGKTYTNVRIRPVHEAAAA